MGTDAELPRPMKPILPWRAFCFIRPLILGGSHMFHLNSLEFRYLGQKTRLSCSGRLVSLEFLLLFLVKDEWCKRKLYDQRTWNMVPYWLSVMLASAVEVIWHTVQNTSVNTLFSCHIYSSSAVCEDESEYSSEYKVHT